MDKSVGRKQDAFLDEFILSADMKKSLRETGRVFTDFEKAIIIYHLECPWKEKKAALCGIMNSTENEALKKQLSERIAYDEECLRLFTARTAGYIYALTWRENRRKEVYGYFADPALAYECGPNEEYPFEIEKYRLIGWNGEETAGQQDTKDSAENWEERRQELLDEDEEDKYYEGPVASLCFDREGRLRTFESREPEEEDPGDEFGRGGSGTARFENAYLDLPNPFERGDIVRVVGEDWYFWHVEDHEVGIVATPQEQWKRIYDSGESSDYTEVNVIVNFAAEDGGFWHEHINQLFLEKCPIPEGEEGERLLALREIMLREEWGEYKDLE